MIHIRQVTNGSAPTRSVYRHDPSKMIRLLIRLIQPDIILLKIFKSFTLDLKRKKETCTYQIEYEPNKIAPDLLVKLSDQAISLTDDPINEQINR